MSDFQIAIFDTETTGLLKPSPAGLDQQPSIIELYACVIDQDLNFVREYESLYSVNFALPDIITNITGITDNDLVGEPTFGEQFHDLAKFFTGVDMMVAHNLNFDSSMIANELLRIDRLINFPWPRHHLCTVEASMKLRGHRLKLADMYNILTEKDFLNAHRAKNDVEALKESFIAMVKKGIINLEALA